MGELRPLGLAAAHPSCCPRGSWALEAVRTKSGCELGCQVSLRENSYPAIKSHLRNKRRKVNDGSAGNL